ncbi:MAG: aminomethyl-transferring glycine dehydrogenase subunit GcvPA [Deltaproteobacteria bacterium]|nr:aminomethyl-transferring glycine dehydrogenase subunit GcvPA [Deltaproteobacteria bacterium]MCB9488399.1 aminomethyl-transferring glycine dehydrogenase subunit GcvPA [Deltaproteobacteria bacterium]
MRYLPHTARDVDEILRTLGLDAPERVFDSIPERLRLQRPLALLPPLSEPEIVAHMEDLAASNQAAKAVNFLGGGAYRHHTPAVLDYLLTRGEFLTAYTPYQAEVAQGTLQAIFEFQTLVARLFDMEVANASVYDGASAAAEAVMMARRLTRSDRVYISGGVHPAYREVIRTYTQFQDVELVELPIGPDGRLSLDAVQGAELDKAAALVVQSPNYFGVIEDLAAIRTAMGDTKCKFVVTFAEPLAYAIAKSPGSCGADIVAGEGASFGLPVNFGGPYVGLFATRKDYVRNLPGRLVGQSVDTENNRAYVLTLATREQHIRREKATSNICTNQALCALAVTIYLSLMGKEGLPKLARLNLSLAEYAKKSLVAAGAKLPFSAPTFNEFVVELPMDAAEFVAECATHGILPGIPVGGREGLGDNALLVCATEVNTRSQIDAMAAILAGSV